MARDSRCAAQPVRELYVLRRLQASFRDSENGTAPIPEQGCNQPESRRIVQELEGVQRSLQQLASGACIPNTCVSEPV